MGHRLGRIGVLAALCVLGSAARASAQFGALVSPGPLSRAHAALEGANNCEKCHEAGRKVTAERCLVCHAPIAKRIAEHVGVHKDVTGDCVQCHVEHAGVDGELRPFDPSKFDHTAQTNFPLDGQHAAVAAKCDSCHKTRSFLTVSPSCASCHADVHKGSLGTNCERCHSAKDAFMKATATFDHSETRFPLVGAHRTAECATCHTGPSFSVPKFASCMDCHQTPHPTTVSTSCATCHGNETWSTRKFDHASTPFPLTGKHALVNCAACHKEPMMKVKPPSATCGACHADPHKGEFKQDCQSCHTDAGFAGAPFDHAATAFPLTDGHAGLSCESCHTAVAIKDRPIADMSADFRGAKTACASCHADPHKGELGASCDSCHSSKTFAVTSFAHPRAQDLFVGRHASAACEACHTPKAGPAGGAGPRLASATFTKTPTACASCHRDVHLGQLSSSCESCHSASAPTFAAAGFNHDQTTFHLTGAHTKVACAQCHKPETADFPSGRGTATRFAGVGATCASCHADIHLGQLGSSCESCHSVDKFKVPRYAHRTPPKDFFVGAHASATCAQCHKVTTGTFPSGPGTAVQFTVGTDCISCHEDVHNGALGTDCASCHKPEPVAAAHAASAVAARMRPGPAHAGAGL